jgi:FkbM family methyltransferase
VPDARLIAFEPVPPVRDELTRNLAGSDVDVVPFALSNEAGPIKINYTPENPHLSSLEAVDESGRIAVQTVEVQRSLGDQICAERGISHIRFLKVDTEGHDLRVIEGFQNLIGSSGVDVIQFEYNYMSIYSRTFLKDFFAALTPTMRIGRLLRNRVEFFDYAPQLDNFIQANFIAVRTDLAKGELAFLSS